MAYTVTSSQGPEASRVRPSRADHLYNDDYDDDDDDDSNEEYNSCIDEEEEEEAHEVES